MTKLSLKKILYEAQLDEMFSSSLSKTFDALDRKYGGYNQVPIIDLIEALGVSKKEFEQKIKPLRMENMYILQPFEGRHRNLDERLALGEIQENGNTYHYVAKRL